MDHRKQKKAAFGFFYFAIFLLLGYLIYLPFKPPETCSDGRENQNETGIDCGGVCGLCQVEPVLEDIEVTETAWVSDGSGKFDLLGKIRNPNNDFGASKVAYEFEIIGSTGGILARESGKTFILPKEEKYVVETSIQLPSEPIQIKLTLTETKWEKFSGYREKPELDVYNRRFEKTSSGVGFGSAKGLVVNNSPFDFTIIDITVVLRDGSGRAVAIQKTDMRTLRAGRQQDFTLLWPSPFSGDVEKVEVQTDANVYDTDTFIRQYVPVMTESFKDMLR